VRIRAASADDVVQDAFIQAFLGLRSLHDPARFGPWFLAVVRNAARRHIRDAGRMAVGGVPEQVGQPEASPVEAGELRDELWRKVGELPDGIREAIFLYYHEGESVPREDGAEPAAPMRGAPGLRVGFFGEVQKPDGTPAPGVRVAAYAAGASAAGEARFQLVSDAEGRFRFVDIEPGAWSLLAESADGFFGMATGVTAPSADPVTIRLEPTYRLEGVVTDEKDVSIPDASVRVVALTGGRAGPLQPFDAKLSAGADGRFIVSAVPDGYYRVAAEVPRYQPGSVAVRVPPKEPVHLRLKGGMYITGRAFLRDRQHPLQEGTLTIQVDSKTGSSGDRVDTDVAGRFFSQPLPSGDHTATFHYQPFAPVTVDLTLSESQPAVEKDVIFRDGIMLSAVARNMSGDPLPWIGLSWHREGAPASAEIVAKTDRHGRFEVTGLDASRYEVKMAGPRRERHGIREVMVSAEANTEVNLRFDISRPIYFRAETPDGMPVPRGCRIYFSQRVPPGSHGPLALDTNEDGMAAQLDYVPGVKLGARAEYRRMMSPTVEVDPDSPPDVVILRLEDPER